MAKDVADASAPRGRNAGHMPASPSAPCRPPRPPAPASPQVMTAELDRLGCGALPAALTQPIPIDRILYQCSCEHWYRRRSIGCMELSKAGQAYRWLLIVPCPVAPTSIERTLVVL